MTGRLRVNGSASTPTRPSFAIPRTGCWPGLSATLLVVCIASSSLTSAVGTGVQAASNVASGAAVGASAGTMANAGDDTGDTATSYFVDSLFRPNDPARLAAPGAEDDAAAAASIAHPDHIAAAASEMLPADRAYLGQLVAARTGLSEAGNGPVRVLPVRQTKAKAQQTNRLAQRPVSPCLDGGAFIDDQGVHRQRGTSSDGRLRPVSQTDVHLTEVFSTAIARSPSEYVFI